MTAADFYNDTSCIAAGRAIHCEPPTLHISPDKSMNCHDTTAGFTVQREFVVFGVLDPKRFAGPALPTRPCCSALYPVSFRRLVVLHLGFLWIILRSIALAFG